MGAEMKGNIAGLDSVRHCDIKPPSRQWFDVTMVCPGYESCGISSVCHCHITLIGGTVLQVHYHGVSVWFCFCIWRVS